LVPLTAIDAQAEQITIGTGGVTGVYYPSGGAICRLMNRYRRQHGIRCYVESTGGSSYNIKALLSGQIQFGIVEPADQARARNAGNLRAVFSFYPQSFALVTTANVPDHVVYHLVNAVFSNFDQFKKLHPAFMNLDPSQMIRQGLSLPLHPGAKRYYRERGL
jgi:TRAP-type uncharacterized transport system substrate-binding protein